MPRPARILVYGSDILLLHTRTMVLENAGFWVYSANQAQDAHALFDTQDVALVVLCHSLSADACESFLRYAGSREPAIKILTLAAGASPCSEMTHGAVLSAFDGPRKLVETVKLLLESASVPL